jgi:hypothetical protein
VVTPVILTDEERAERRRAIVRTTAGVLVGLAVATLVVLGAFFALLMIAFATMDV